MNRSENTRNMDAQEQSHAVIGTTDFPTIGFGEAASAFVQGLNESGAAITARSYDIKTDAVDSGVSDAKWSDYSAAGVIGQADMATLLRGAGLVFSLVTADQANSAASAAALHIELGCYYFDGNSCAPKTKQNNAKLIEAAGGHYIDMAIMSPVHPRLHKAPVLLSGPKADNGRRILAELGMSAKAIDGRVGHASSIKMIRSIMMKGLEALMAECVLAGRRAGVEEVVLESLDKSYPGLVWKDRAAYGLERMMVHGERRAAEMREVVRTIDDLGLSSAMSRATVGWQQNVGDLGIDPGDADFDAMLETLLSEMDQSKDETTKNLAGG